MIRDSKGKYSKRKTWLKVVIFVILLALFTYMVWATVFVGKQITAVNITPTVSADVTMEWKVSEMQKKIISDLEECESGNNSAPLIQYDNNSHGTLTGKDIPSIGVLRFKIGTIQTYEKQLYGVTMSEKDAIILALDTSKSEALASDIIFKTDGGLWNWSCATPDMGAEVTVIKELLK